MGPKSRSTTHFKRLGDPEQGPTSALLNELPRPIRIYIKLKEDKAKLCSLEFDQDHNKYIWI